MYRPNSFGPNPFGPTPSAQPLRPGVRLRIRLHERNGMERCGTERAARQFGQPSVLFSFQTGLIGWEASASFHTSPLYLFTPPRFRPGPPIVPVLPSSRSSHRPGPPIVPVLPSSRSSHRSGPLFAPEPLSGGMSVVVGLHYIRYNWASVTSSSSSIVYFTTKRPGSSGAGVTEVPMRSR